MQRSREAGESTASNLKRAILVGASSGIGRELARVLVREGWRVGVIARREALLRELEEEFPDSVLAVAADVADLDASGSAIQTLTEQLGGIDLAVLSAGVGFPSPDLTWEETSETLEINVRGWTFAANTFMRHFEAHGGGHLVNFSSLAALRGHGGAPAYYASKSWASNYMQGLRHRSVKGKRNITVTDIQLGLVRTAMAKVDRIPRWVVGPEVAAEHVWKAIRRRRSHAYVTPAWRFLAWAIRLTPNFLWNRLSL